MTPEGGALPLTRALLGELTAEFPRFRLVAKEGDALSRVIDRLLRVITLGAQDRYLTEYFTVLGDTLYFPPGWDRMSDVDRVILLRHERVHLRQRRRLGTVGMALVYLLPLLPVGLSLGRARLEWEAYAETLRATAELLGPEAARSPELRRRIISRFTGPDYAWMWPFPAMVGRWVDGVLSEVAPPSAGQE